MYAAVTSVNLTSDVSDYRTKNKEFQDILKPIKEEPDCCERFCDRRSKLEKRLILGVTLALIIFLFLLRSYLSDNEEKYCFSDDCTVTASNLLESMDTTKDPCTDFYRYACGGWAKNRLIRGKTAAEHNGLTREELLKDLRGLFGKSNENNESLSIIKMKKLFQQCENQSTDDVVDAAAKIMTEKFGDWPLLSPDWKENQTDLMDLVGLANRMGFHNTLLSIRIGNNPFNTAEKRIIIGQPMRLQNMTAMLRFSHENEWNSIKELVQSIEYQKIHSEDLNLMEEVFDKVHELKTEEDSFRQIVNKFELWTIRQLNKKTKKKLDWMRLFNTYFNGIKELNDTQEIIITNLDYIKNLPKIFNSFSKSTLANYVIATSLTQFLLLYLDDNQEDWEICVNTVHYAFPLAAARLYVEEKDYTHVKNEVEPMVEVIIEEMKTLVEESKWLDDTTKHSIIVKLDALKVHVGYPNWIMNDQELDLHYFDYNITDSFLENLLMFREIQFKKLVEDYEGQIISENSESYRPLEMHIVYFPRINSIVIPIAVLRNPVYVSGRIAAANFANLGFLIGHELFHTFDQTGMKFDKDGNHLRGWGRDMLEIFVNMTRCFEYQDNDFCPAINYTDDNRCGSEDVMMEEMAADNSGLKTAFRAYIGWIRKTEKDLHLPGLGNFLPYQIFFLSFANMWCENEDDITAVPEDYGNPTIFRLWSALANSREFADAFDCWKGPMFRGSDKCSIW